jgi:signal transduction histidine kinase
VEGAMRDHAHALEGKKGIALADVLMLRRHEKDFLLRRETQYIEKFNTLADRLVFNLHHSQLMSTSTVLSAYQNEFNHLTYLTHEIGITPQSGLLGTLNGQTVHVSENLGQLNVLVNQRKAGIITESAIWFGIISAILIISSCVLTYFTSTWFARPIKKLNQSMGKFMLNEGLNEKDLEASVSNDEISSLSASFIKMSRKLKSQFHEILKQNSELKNLNEELDRFIYSAAHDLKSPLASLQGLVHLAEKEIDSSAHRHYFQMMSASVRKLNGFIHDITDYAKNKRQAIVVEKVDILTMIEEIIESLRFLPHADRVQVHIRIEGKEFFTDKTRLEIILKNLIGNSFRYMDSTKSKSHIRIEGMVYDQHLKLSVEDNGIGIGKQHLGKIFQMFYRAVEHSKGTGIGLFLVKESVKMLRGKIGVKSNLGEWTVFHLKIPNFIQGHINVPESSDVIENAEVLTPQ